MDTERRIDERTRFDIIRYANCWEDADVLLQALDVKEGGTYLSIASAGDNTLSILSRKPVMLLAIDISGAQLACLELKKAAFLTMTYDRVQRFLGIKEESDRLGLYRQLRSQLSTECQRFWDAHPAFIENGIIHSGRLEDYFRIFRKWLLPVIHRKNQIEELLRSKKNRERAMFYREHWDTWRWRFLFRIFCSRAVLGRLGRDPEFFRYVKGKVANRLLERTEYAMTVLPTDQNPYLTYILTGNFREALPFYLRKENFDNIRDNLGSLVMHKGDLLSALKRYKSVRFDGCNLSDIFEYMSQSAYHDEIARAAAACREGARLVYWNMLADRVHPEALDEKLVTMLDIGRSLFLQDKAFFYKRLIVERVN